MKPIILCVVGTRPEAIKMAPVIQQLQKDGWADVRVLLTAQHRELVDQVFNHFGIVPDFDLNLMSPNQSLTELTSKILIETDKIITTVNPACIVVQGDTTTVLAVSLAGFYKHIPIAHVEAGLRTGDLSNPFPEEANRVLTSKMTRWHFAPTQEASLNLLNEGVNPSRITITGNTVIDALEATVSGLPATNTNSHKRQVLITLHRRENFGAPLEEALKAIAQLASEYPEVEFIFPVHPNPNVRAVTGKILSNKENVSLVEPFEYPQFVRAMRDSHFIITDSGGVQEEAPFLGKPILVLRNETERPEAVAAGLVKLIGTDGGKILEFSRMLLDDNDFYSSMSKGYSPYGDGKAAGRISNVLRTSLS